MGRKKLWRSLLLYNSESNIDLYEGVDGEKGEVGAHGDPGHPGLKGQEVRFCIFYSLQINNILSKIYEIFD